MNDLQKYMDRITADQELKDRTKNYVRSALAGTIEKQVAFMQPGERGSKAMKKRVIAASAMAACAVFAIGGYAFYQTPVSYVSIDINPSVELGVNAFNQVVEVTPVNEDGKTIVADANLTNQSVQQAVNTLVQAAAENGFVAADGSTVIAVTSETGDEQKAEDLQEAGQEGANAALEDKKINAVVYTNAANPELRAEAKEAGISPGKYKMIKLLMILDPTITVDDYKDAKMTAIIEKANELLSSSDNVDEQIAEIKEAFTIVKDTASQVEENKGKGNGKGKNSEDTSSVASGDTSSASSSVSSKNGNGNAYGTSKKTTSSTVSKVEEEQEQEQNQGTVSNTEQNKNQNGNGNGNGNANGKGNAAASSAAVSGTVSASAAAAAGNGKGNGKG